MGLLPLGPNSVGRLVFGWFVEFIFVFLAVGFWSDWPCNGGCFVEVLVQV